MVITYNIFIRGIFFMYIMKISDWLYIQYFRNVKVRVTKKNVNLQLEPLCMVVIQTEIDKETIVVLKITRLGPCLLINIGREGKKMKEESENNQTWLLGK